jgi:hypothetical protein
LDSPEATDQEETSQIEEISKQEAPDEENSQDEQPTMTEEEILQKLSEFLQASQTPATMAAKKLEEAPTMKRIRLSYHFEKSFPTSEEFHAWWSGPRSEHMIHNSTYLNNAGEKIDIYR